MARGGRQFVARRDQDGAAAVEFALVLPVLLSLVFGIISFGLIFAQELSLGNGARQGARFGVVPGNDCAAIAVETRNASSTIGMADSDVEVEIRLGVDEATADATVCSNDDKVPCLEATSPDQRVFVFARHDASIPVPFVTTTVPLESVGVFRCEFSS